MISRSVIKKVLNSFHKVNSEAFGEGFDVDDFSSDEWDQMVYEDVNNLREEE